MTKRIVVPPPREVIEEIAKGVSERMGRPDTRHDLANFLEIVAQMQANALNRVAEEPEKD